MQFTALKTFFCSETQSEYCEGMSYTVRPFAEVDNPAWDDKTKAQVRGRCEALAKLAPQWLKEGKIRPGGPAGGSVRGG